MVSFDVKSIFTNVPLDQTLDIILKRIYDHKELETRITRCEMKEIFTLCAKNVHTTEISLYRSMVLLQCHCLDLY